MIKENELLRMLMLLADTQAWLNELNIQCMNNLHPRGIKLLQGKSYRLSITAFAHIVERHYYKTMRHPGTGKFQVPLPMIIELIREAGAAEAMPVKGSTHLKRSLHCNEPIGITQTGETAFSITVITDATGNIITAYPE